MALASELTVTSLSTWIVFLVLLMLMAFKPPLGFILIMLWTLLLVSDLHTALPDSFYESEALATRWIAVSFAFHVLFLGVASFGALVAWIGIDIGWRIPFLVWLGVGLPGVVAHAYVVRHVLSAIETLERGHPSVAGWGMVVLNVLIAPLFVLSSHYHARRQLTE